MFRDHLTDNRLVGFFQAFCGLFLSVGLIASAQVGESVTKPLADSPVLARTGGQTITVADIDFLLGRSKDPSVAGTPPLAPPNALSPSTLATAIELLALQRQALATLRKKKQAASQDEIETAIRAGAAPEQRDWPAEQIIDNQSKQYGIEVEKIHDSIDFKLSWPRYLHRHLTEENLQKHFESQRRRFNGTRFKIDLITQIVPVGQSPLRDQAQLELTVLRTQLVESEAQANWEQIVEQANNRRKTMITLGLWIRPTGDLAPGLTTALLQLNSAQLSQPIHTAGGVHLIRWTESETGKYELPEVSSDVRTHMLLYLLEFLAKQSAGELPLVNLQH